MMAPKLRAKGMLGRWLLWCAGYAIGSIILALWLPDTHRLGRVIDTMLAMGLVAILIYFDPPEVREVRK